MIRAVTSRAGVTSKAGLKPLLPWGGSCTSDQLTRCGAGQGQPLDVSHLLGERASIGISATPSARVQSMVEAGRAT